MGSVWSRAAWIATSLGMSVGCSDAAVHAPVPEGSSRSADSTECNSGPYLQGVDVYDGTGSIDWAEAKTAGIGFAIIKATQGNYDTQSTFATNWAGAKAAGIARSAYHFFDPTVDGVAQANYFLSVMGKLEAGDMPPTLDIECPDGDADCLGTGASGDASGATITTAMNDWLSTVKAATGVAPFIYSFESYFSSDGVDTTGLESYPLYIAYPTTSDCFGVPSPWTSATIWQNSWTGTVSGIPSPGNTDTDRFLGTQAEFEALLVGSKTGAPFVAPSEMSGNDAVTLVNWPDGHIELFGETTNGTSIHTHTSGSGDTWSAPASLSGSSECALSSVLWAPGSGKSAQVFDALPNGSTVELTGSASTWTAYAPFGGSGLSHLSSLAFADGRVEVFGLGTDGAIWHDAWLLSSKAWSGWQSLGGSGMATGAGPILASDGHAEIFATDAHGRAWRNSTASATSTAWGGWIAMPGAELATRPVPARWNDGHLEVFARGTDNNLYTSDAAGGSWPAFTPINAGTPIEGEPSVLVYADYGPEVFARDPKGEVIHAWYETNAFVAWAADLNETLASDPMAWTRPDGQGEVFGVDTAGHLVKSIHDGPDWSGWTSLAADMDDCSSIPKPDTGKSDGGGVGRDAGLPGLGAGSEGSGGCGCRAVRHPPDSEGVLSFGFGTLALIFARRRGRRGAVRR
jgi:GH25 family lysozyme M1 (1,4-beta-N-acetylmuramidase)